MNLEKIMGRQICVIVLLIGVLCPIDAQSRLYPNEIREYNLGRSNDDELRDFITRMYNDRLYEDYDFLQRYCSAELLKKLRDAYPYDSDAVAYATWLFRSGRQDGKPGSDEKSIMLDVKRDGDWFVYTALDMGWEFTNRIKITNKSGEIVIDDVCAVKKQM